METKGLLPGSQVTATGHNPKPVQTKPNHNLNRHYCTNHFMCTICLAE